MLQQYALNKTAVLCLLHFNIDAVTVRSRCADVKSARLDLREDDVDFRILDGNRGNAIFTFELEDSV